MIRLGGEWEMLFTEHEAEIDGRRDVILPPEEFNRLARAVGEALAGAAARGVQAVVLVPGTRRRFLRQVLEAKGVEAPVVAFEEVGHRTPLALVGTA